MKIADKDGRLLSGTGKGLVCTAYRLARVRRRVFKARFVEADADARAGICQGREGSDATV